MTVFIIEFLFNTMMVATFIYLNERERAKYRNI